MKCHSITCLAIMIVNEFAPYQTAIDKMTVDEMTVIEMSVDEMPAGDTEI